MKEQMLVRMPASLKERIEKVAEDQGYNSCQEFVRSAIRDKLGQEQTVSSILPTIKARS